MLKRLFLIAGLCTVVAIVGFYCWADYQYRHFLDRTIPEYMGITHYITERVHRDDGSWTVRLRISPEDGTRLAHRYAFEPGFALAIIQGNWAPDFVQDCFGCSYTYEKLGSLYRYRLFVLSPDRTELIIHETFSNM